MNSITQVELERYELRQRETSFNKKAFGTSENISRPTLDNFLRGVRAYGLAFTPIYGDKLIIEANSINAAKHPEAKEVFMLATGMFIAMKYQLYLGPIIELLK